MMEFRELVGLNLVLLRLNTALLQTNTASVTILKKLIHVIGNLNFYLSESQTQP